MICPDCKVEYSSQFAFCTKCGTKLEVLEPEQSKAQPQPSENIKDEQGNFLKDSINGVPVATVSNYVGNGSDTYINKFKKYSGGTKAGWNLPVFLFGILLNAPFIWFFYRKMYKLGAIFLAISLVFTIGNALTTVGMINSTKDALQVATEDLVHDIEKIEYKYDISVPSEQNSQLALHKDKEREIEKVTTKAIVIFEKEIIKNSEFIVSSMVSNLLSVINLVYIVLLSIFANYCYYKNTFANISVQGKKGGTDSVSATLTGVFASIAQMAIIIIPCVISIIDLVNSLLEVMPIK